MSFLISISSNLLVQPILLHCDHMLCSDCFAKLAQEGLMCPSCKLSFCNKDARPAKHIRKFVSLYGEMDSSLGKLLQMPTTHAPENKKGANSASDKQDSNISNFEKEEENDNKSEVGSSRNKTGVGKKEIEQSKAARVKHLLQKSRTIFGDECKFCHSFRTTEVSGPMRCYINGKLVGPKEATQSEAVHVHENCSRCVGVSVSKVASSCSFCLLMQGPRVYFDGDTVKNVEAELKRASKIRCNKCGRNSAALGCYNNECKKRFHVSCAIEIPDCRWDCVYLHMLCPTHASEKLPCDDILPKKEMEENNLSSIEIGEIPMHAEKQIADPQNNDHTSLLGVKRNLLFIGSSLSESEKKLLDKFVSLTGIAVSKKWSQDLTHVIASTNVNGAFKRSFEILMAIASGKWILSFRWMEACLERGRLVSEEPYELNLDLNVFTEGPRKARLRLMDKATNLFTGLRYYFSKFLTCTDQNRLKELALSAGGAILKHTSSLESNADGSKFYFVYSETETRKCDRDVLWMIKEERCREALETSKFGAMVVGHTMFLNAIADSDVGHLKKAAVNREV